jgi:C1A family cysteine protease
MIENADVNPKPAMKVLRKYGAVPESLLPFKIRTEMYTGSQKAFYATAAQYRIAAYFNLKRDLNHWRSWLVEHGPIMAGVRIDATFHDAASTKGMLDTFQPDTIKGGHAVTVVGYTDAGRFILRNSWGTVWGDKGFAYASEDYINAAFFEESYGVTV